MNWSSANITLVRINASIRPKCLSESRSQIRNGSRFVLPARGARPRLSRKHESSSSTSQVSRSLTSSRHVKPPAQTQTLYEPTIYALSSAPGRAAIAVIRISGQACLHVYRKLCPTSRDPRPRYAAIRKLTDPRDQNEVLDSSSLVLLFPAPRTVTGEDVLELHVHGGPAIVKRVLAAIASCKTTELPIRYAEPGEFTRRAFMNDRLSLPQVEALGETLNAVTEEQRRVALAGTENGLGDRYERWRSILLAARGELEALIDFAEDQHFDESPRELAANVAAQVRRLLHLLTLHSRNAMRGELLRHGITLSLIGSPNVGKSSLLNSIAGRDAAIVSSEAGTTRDIVEVGIDIGGFFCRLSDTAGIRFATFNAASSSIVAAPTDLSQGGNDAIGAVEVEGIKRARAQAEASDLVLLMLSIEPSVDGVGVQLKLDEEVMAIARDMISRGKKVIVIVNKMDRYAIAADPQAMHTHLQRALCEVLPSLTTDDMCFVSCKVPDQHHGSPDVAFDSDPGNIQQLLESLTKKFRSMTAPLTDDILPADEEGLGMDNLSQASQSLGATERQRVLLDECASELAEFLAQVETPFHDANIHLQDQHSFADDEADDNLDIVLAAESLRRAADCLARITGRNADAGDVEEVLGVVFEK